MTAPLAALQRLQAPDGHGEKAMYCRTQAVWDERLGCFAFRAGEDASFAAYFNVFSLAKWKKYTALKTLCLRLRLAGAVEVSLTGIDPAKTGAREIVLARKTVSSGAARDFVFEYPECSCSLAAFSLRPLSDAALFDGAYCSPALPDAWAGTGLALVICTYRREAYVRANIKRLKDGIFFSKESPLRERLWVYVIDNGRTLPLDTGCAAIKVIPNKNAGGAAGFARGMLEALDDRERRGLTHLILMDDDVVFTHWALERAAAFLSLLRPEWRNSALGGAMLLAEKPAVQHSAGYRMGPRGIESAGMGLDMSRLCDAAQNEAPRRLDYFAWWFCCFPLDDGLRGNLPLPLFFQYDDTEWAARNRSLEMITLNGVCVWHDSFGGKWSEARDYYALRNHLIYTALHGGTPGALSLAKFLFSEVTSRLFVYRYEGAALLLRAISDFCRGPDFLAETCAAQLHAEILAAAGEPPGPDQCPADIRLPPDADALQEARRGGRFCAPESAAQKLARALTLNGLFLNARGRTAAVRLDAAFKSRAAYRAERVFVYDGESRRGIVTRRDAARTLALLFRLGAALCGFFFKYGRAAARYRERRACLASEDFWRKYLSLPAR